MLIQETGAGLSNANSYIDQTYASGYAADRGLTYSPQDKFLILATDYLANEARLPYVGTRHSSSQRLPWPRDGASERGGLAIASGVIPTRLMDAEAELAILVSNGTSLQDDLDNGGLLIQREQVDVIDTQYFAPTALQLLTGIPGETLRTAVIGFLSPILRLPGARLVVGTLVQPCDESPFIPGQFDTALGSIPVSTYGGYNP